MRKSSPSGATKSGPSLLALLRPYRLHIGILAFLTIAANGSSLIVPRLVATSIDAYIGVTYRADTFIVIFAVVSMVMFVFTYLQNVYQTVTAERVARDLRMELTAKISEQTYATIQQTTPATLLTHLTSDIDAVKNFIAQGVSTMISSAFLIIGTSVLLLQMNWRLACIVLLVIPIIGGTFYVIFGRVRKLFKTSQEAIDRLNGIINESIVGAALIRLLNSQRVETMRFNDANTASKDIGMRILRLFASMIPIITFTTNAAMLAIVALGGHFVISGSMSLGSLTAFYSYLAILIFPIVILGFTSNVIAQSSASYARISDLLTKKTQRATGTIVATPGGSIELNGVSVRYGEKLALKDVSFRVPTGTKTAIIGPTAAGKTQLLYALTGLITPTNGNIRYGNRPLADYDPVSLHRHIAFVFQDSVLFNLSLRENIAFSDTRNDERLNRAISAAELADFIDTLPNGLDTIVSERGTSLSGGQKQRIMLARALTLEPSVLLLDDFTARVDVNTERRILANVERLYPGLTIISVTQKVESVAHYDQLVVLMEGELIAHGTLAELLESCPEFVQIYESQRSTSTYEVRPE